MMLVVNKSGHAAFQHSQTENSPVVFSVDYLQKDFTNMREPWGILHSYFPNIYVKWYDGWTMLLEKPLIWQHMLFAVTDIFRTRLGAVSMKRCLTNMGIPMLKISRYRDRLIFNMRIPIPGKDGLYIETGPWSSHENTRGHDHIEVIFCQVINYIFYHDQPCIV